MCVCGGECEGGWGVGTARDEKNIEIECTHLARVEGEYFVSLLDGCG